MLLSELIQHDLVKLNLEAIDKWAAIEELVDHLIAAHELRIGDRQDAIDAVFARERSLSTGLEHSLAVPHGAGDFVSDILGCIGISRRGIPFDSLDGKDARLIVLLIIPKDAFQRHVRTLAGIARLARNPEFRERIIAAEDADQVMDAIIELETLEESRNAERDGAR
jgi:mannitol/fructose-specific phosphotransferase system IIA component (Ntr-type)